MKIYQANGIDISENMIYAAKMRYPDMKKEHIQFIFAPISN